MSQSEIQTPIPTVENAAVESALHSDMPASRSNNTGSNLAPEDSDGTVQTGLGITFQQSQNTIASGVKKVDEPIQCSISDRVWTVRDCVSRPTLTADIAWNTSQAAGTRLGSWNVPSSLLNSRSVGAGFHNFNYFRGNVVIRAYVNASPMHQGAVKIYFRPLTGDYIERNLYYNATGQTMRSSIPTLDSKLSLDASKSTVAEMVIPFRHVMDYITLPAGDNISTSMGVMYAVVYNTLLTGTSGTNSVNITMTVSFTESHFAVPRIGNFTNNSLIAPVAAAIGLTAASNIVDAFHQDSGKTSKESMVPSGSHCPITVEPPSNMNTRSLMNLSTSKVVRRIDKLTLDPATPIDTSVNAVGFGVDECAMENLTTRFSLLGTVSWQGSSPANHLITQFPISPVSVRPEAEDTPNLEYLSRAFAFWRGGFVYWFQVVGTEFHQGTLFAGVHYNPSGATVAGDYTTQYGSYLSVRGGKRDFFVHVPFVSPTPSKSVPNTCVFQDPVLDSTLGILSLSVVNKLAYPSTVHGSVDVNIFVAAAPGFKFHGLKGIDYSSYVLDSPSLNALLVLREEADAADEDVTSEEKSVIDRIARLKALIKTHETSLQGDLDGAVRVRTNKELMKYKALLISIIGEERVDKSTPKVRTSRRRDFTNNSNMHDGSINKALDPVFSSEITQMGTVVCATGDMCDEAQGWPQFGEYITSLLEVLRRTYPQQDYAFSGAGSYDLGVLNRLMSGVWTDKVVPIFAHYTRLYSMFRGSIRLHIELTSTNALENSASIYYHPMFPPSPLPASYDSQRGSMPIAILNSRNNICEIELPYVGNTARLETVRVSNNEGAGFQAYKSAYGYVNLQHNGPGSSIFRIYQSISNDARYMGYCGNPKDFTLADRSPSCIKHSPVITSN